MAHKPTSPVVKQLTTEGSNGGHSVRLTIEISETLKLFKQGITSSQAIGEKLGISPFRADRVKRATYEYLREEVQLDAEQYRAYEYSKLLQLEQTLQEQLDGGIAANTLNVTNITNLVNAISALSEKRSKLMGLYTQKIEVEQRKTVDIEITAIKAGEILALMEASGALADSAIEGSYAELPGPSEDSESVVQSSDTESSDTPTT